MTPLTPRESEMVSLAAALASNCVPCVEHHVPEARRAGLSDSEIRAVLDLADAVRHVPAAKTLRAAEAALGAVAPAAPPDDEPCIGVSTPAGRWCC